MNTIVPRYYQVEAVNAIYDYFRINAGNPIVAMPTGTGKSIVIGSFFQRALQAYPSSRFICATHVKELIKQNADKLVRMWPQAPIGIHSAAFEQRDTAHPIIFGGIRSMLKYALKFGYIDILFIDECQLVGEEEDSDYLQFIALLRTINPRLKIVGLSATPFRMGMGMLTDGEIFTDVCYDITGLEAFNKLIAEGYISPPIPKRTATALDVSNVGMYKSEFAQKALQSAVDQEAITRAALKETCEAGADRQCWLIFASGIEHSEHIAEMLRSYGVSAAAVHSKVSDDYRDAAVKAHQDGSLRCIVGNNIFTTGYDNEIIDLIADLQPTMSVVKHVQKIGRGTRPSPSTGKRNCLVLDFARNTQRLGPINDPVLPRKKGEGTGEVPIKICEHCGTYNHTKVRYCTNCGEEFSFEVKIIATAGTDDLIRGDLPIVENFNVDYVVYGRYVSKAGMAQIRVKYFCGLRTFDEWINFEGAKSHTRHVAHEWWRQRHKAEPPATNDEVLLITSQLRPPRRIRVWVNCDYPKVLGYEF